MKMNHGKIIDHFDDARTTLARLERDINILQLRLHAWAKDGYPSGGSSIGSKGGFSDPTGNAALGRDEVRADREEFETLIEEVSSKFLRLESIRKKYVDVQTATATHNAGLVACANQHGCPDQAWATKAGRCPTCYEYKRVNQRDRRKGTKSD